MSSVKTFLKSLFNARPHPGPLPRGEGESFAVPRKNTWVDSRGGQTNNTARPITVPSPSGAGQGEGGRSSHFDQINSKLC